MERATQERLVGATLLIVAGVILIPWLLDGSMTQPGVNEQELVLPGGLDEGNETRRISLDVPRQNVPGSTGAAPVSARNQPAATSSAAVSEIDARTVRGVDELASINLPKPKPVEASSEVPSRFAKPMPDTQSMPVQAVASAGTSQRAAPKPVKPEPRPAAREAAADPANKPASVASPAATTSAQAPSVQSQVVDTAWAVQVGSFASKENAERLAARLRDKSYQAFVMRNVVDGRVRFRVRVGPVSQRNQAELLATALRDDRQPARVLSHP